MAPYKIMVADELDAAANVFERVCKQHSKNMRKPGVVLGDFFFYGEKRLQLSRTTGPEWLAC